MKNKTFLFLASLLPFVSTSCVDDSLTLSLRGVLSVTAGECIGPKADGAVLQRVGVLDLSLSGGYSGHLLIESSTLTTKTWKNEGGGQSGGSTLDIVNPKYANAVSLQSFEFKCVGDLCKNFSYPYIYLMSAGSVFAPSFIIPIIPHEEYVKMTTDQIKAKYQELEGKELNYEISVKYKNNLSSIKGESNRFLFGLRFCYGCLSPMCKVGEVPDQPNQCAAFGSDVRWNCKKLGGE